MALAAVAAPAAAPGAGGYASDYGSDYGVGQERRRVLRQPVAVIGLRARTMGGTLQPWAGLRFGDALSRRLEPLMGRAPSAGALARALAGGGVRAQDIGSLRPRGARSAPTDRALTILKPALQVIMRVQPAATAAASRTFGGSEAPRLAGLSNSSPVSHTALVFQPSATMTSLPASATLPRPVFALTANSQGAPGAASGGAPGGASGAAQVVLQRNIAERRLAERRSAERSALVLMGDMVLGGPVTRPGSSLSVTVSVLRVWDAPARAGGIGIEAVLPAVTLQAPARDWAQLPARTALAVLDALQIPMSEDERVSLLRDASPLMPAATARLLASEQRLGEAIAGAINAYATQVQARRAAPLAARRLMLARAIQQGARAEKELRRVAASPGAAPLSTASSQTPNSGAVMLVSGGATERAALAVMARTAREWVAPTALAVKQCRRQLRALPAASTKKS